METLIGSDPAHTSWCHRIARERLRALKKRLGVAWDMFGAEIRDALLATQLTGLVNTQENEQAPIWRMQELIQVAQYMLSPEESER